MNLRKKARVWRAVRSVCSHYDRVRYLDAIDTKANIQIFFVEEHKTIYSDLLSGEIVDFDFPKVFMKATWLPTESIFGRCLRNIRNILICNRE